MSEWNALQYSVASAFLSLVYSDYMQTSQTKTLYCNGELYQPNDLRKFALSQVFYYPDRLLCLRWCWFGEGGQGPKHFS